MHVGQEIHTFRQSGLLGLACQEVYQETDQKLLTLEVMDMYSGVGGSVLLWVGRDADAGSSVVLQNVIDFASSGQTGYLRITSDLKPQVLSPQGG